MKKLFLVAIAMSLSSCASIIEGSSQEVSIRTEPNVPAECTITGSDFSTTAEVPGKVKIQRSYYPAEIKCTPKSGGESGSVKAVSDVAGIGYAGAVFGTAIGAGVDTYTGAAFEYPAEIVVELGKTTIIGKNNMNSNVE